jgi:hypothetical protein
MSPKPCRYCAATHACPKCKKPVPENVDPASVLDTICGGCGEWRFCPLFRTKAKDPYLVSPIEHNYCPVWEPLPPSEVLALKQLRELTARAGRAAGASPDQQAGGRPEGAGPSREQLIQQMKPSVRKAYYAFEYAQSRTGKGLTDREAYDLLTEEGIAEGAGDQGELTDYELPRFDTWTGHLRRARNSLGEQKHTRRAGRTHGPSIVRADQIEGQQDVDQ